MRERAKYQACAAVLILLAILLGNLLDEATFTEMEPQAWMPEQPGTYYGRYDPASGLVHVGMILAPFHTEPISKEEYEEAFLRLTGFAAEDPFA